MFGDDKWPGEAEKESQLLLSGMWKWFSTSSNKCI